MSSDGMPSEPGRSRTLVLGTLSRHLMCSRCQSQPLLSGIGCPGLTAIKESRQDISLVDAHLCPFAQGIIAGH